MATVVAVGGWAASSQAANDLVYKTSGGDWWARTYEPGGSDVSSGTQAAPEFHMFTSSQDHLVFGQMNNDIGGLNDNLYVESGLYYARTWIPASPQPGPAAALASNDVNMGIGYASGAGGNRPVILSDFNNNGASDFLYEEGTPAGTWYARQYAPAAPQPGPGGTFTAETNTGFGGPLVIGDYNNDGLVDLINIDGSDRYRVNTLTQGAGETNSQFHANNGTTGPAVLLNSASLRPLQIADINNDGKEDVVYQESSNTTWYFRTYEPDTATPDDLTDGVQIGSDIALVNSPTLIIGDYNNDGLTDILFPLNSTWRAATVATDGSLGPFFDLGISTANQIVAITNFNNSAPVPEPASAALLLCGGGLLTLRRRK
jgi:hypothetical protein